MRPARSSSRQWKPRQQRGRAPRQARGQAQTACGGRCSDDSSRLQAPRPGRGQNSHARGVASVGRVMVFDPRTAASNRIGQSSRARANAQTIWPGVSCSRANARSSPAAPPATTGRNQCDPRALEWRMAKALPARTEMPSGWGPRSDRAPATPGPNWRRIWFRLGHRKRLRERSGWPTTTPPVSSTT